MSRPAAQGGHRSSRGLLGQLTRHGAPLQAGGFDSDALPPAAISEPSRRKWQAIHLCDIPQIPSQAPRGNDLEIVRTRLVTRPEKPPPQPTSRSQPHSDPMRRPTTPTGPTARAVQKWRRLVPNSHPTTGIRFRSHASLRLYTSLNAIWGVGIPPNRMKYTALVAHRSRSCHTDALFRPMSHFRKLSIAPAPFFATKAKRRGGWVVAWVGAGELSAPPDSRRRSPLRRSTRLLIGTNFAEPSTFHGICLHPATISPFPLS